MAVDWKERQNEASRAFTQLIQKKQAERDRDHRNRHALRLKRKAEGKCTRCGKNPPRPNRNYCETCKKQETKYKQDQHRRQHEARSALGLCWYCPKEDIHEAMPGTHICGYCRELRTEHQLALEKKWLAEGKCCCCGKEIDHFHEDGSPYKTCKRHTEVKRKRSKKWYDKTKKDKTKYLQQSSDGV